MSGRTTPQPGMLPTNPRLSVCMIVRDEEKVLPRCLESVQGIADELIVVDTGSKDNTSSIAKDFGARLYHFEWCDDYAAARNESLRHATGDWILQMDADEELLATSISPLKKAMSNPWCLLYIIRCDHGPTCVPQFGWVGRLFHNHPRVRYSRAYYEMVTDSVVKLMSKEPEWQKIQYIPNIIIRHHGHRLSEAEMVKKHTRGLRVMEAYVEENPEDTYILTKMGGIYCNLKYYEDAEKYLRKAMKIDRNCVETRYNLGVTLQRQGKLDGAMELYEKVLTMDPHFAEAHTDLGLAYMQKGMLDQAMTEFKKALDIDPDLVRAQTNLGATYRQKGMLDEAISELKKVLAVNPDYAEVHKNLGVAYGEKDMLDEAISHLEKAISIDPDFAEAHTDLGLAYMQKGMLDQAMTEFKKALDINPDLAEAHNNMGAAYRKNGMPDEAVTHFKKAIAIKPDYAEAHTGLGVAYGDKDMIDEPITHFKKAIAIKPDYAEAHNNLAVAYYLRKQYELAIKHCDKAILLGYKVHPDFLLALNRYR